MILFIGTCLVAAEHQTPLHFFYGDFYIIASLVIDLGGVALIVGLSMFLYRRVARSDGRILRAWWVVALWHDLLQADTCTTCGRCNEVCPAMSAGKPLQPREVVLGIRAAMDGGANSPPLSATIDDDVVWSCTTCGACNEACPVGIDVFGKIVEMRRGRVELGNLPAIAQRLLELSAAEFNPFDRPHNDRLLWSTGLDLPIAREGETIPLLYWVGCAGSFDPDGQSVARHMIRILMHLGIDFRVLGERCTGDPARRMGEEGLFRELAAENIAQFGEHSVERILTHCPHCFNTFANEYPELGGHYQVEQHGMLRRPLMEGLYHWELGVARSCLASVGLPVR